MSDNIVDFSKRQHQARHERKEAGFDEMKQRFTLALASEKEDKQKILSLFKKKKNSRTPKKSQ